MLKLQSSCRSGMTHTDQGSTTPLTLEFPPRGSCSTWAPEIHVNLLYFWKLELGHIVLQFQVSGQEREEKHETGAFSETPAWVAVFFISFYIWIPCELHCHSSSRAALPQSHPLSLYTSLTALFVLIPELVSWALSPLYSQIRDLFWVIHDFYSLFIFYKFVFIRSAWTFI